MSNVEEFSSEKRHVSKERLKELYVRSDARGWAQTLSHIGAIMISTYILDATWGSYWAILAFIIQGTLINYLYAGVHELSHWTVFNTRRLNDIFGHLFSFSILHARESDRLEHTYHHRYTHDLERDAEIYGKGAYNLWTWALYMLGPGYWVGMLKEILKHALGIAREGHFSEKNKKLVIFEARMYFLGYTIIALASYYAESTVIVYYWLAPLLLLKVMHQVENATEHTGMPHVEGIFINTRSIKTLWVMRWLCWQMPYHTAHHTYPAVPFWKLKTLHKELFTDHDREPETIGYISFQWHMLKKLLKEGHSAYSGKKISEY